MKSITLWLICCDVSTLAAGNAVNTSKSPKLSSFKLECIKQKVIDEYCLVTGQQSSSEKKKITRPAHCL